MQRLLFMLAIGAVVALGAWLIRSRKAVTGPTQTGSTPDHLDRSHFVAPAAEWLIAVFSSSTCLACAEVTRTLATFESDRVAFQDIDHKVDAELHRRYSIDSVPTTVIANREGVVKGAWIGPLSPADRDALVATLTPEATPS